MNEAKDESKHLPVVRATGVIEETDSLQIRFAEAQCCCGCDALNAAKTIAILGFIFSIIGIINYFFQPFF